MKDWLIRHVVRVATVVAAMAPVVASLVSSLPWEYAAGISAVIVSAGEVAQRIENDKTLAAYLETPTE